MSDTCIWTASFFTLVTSRLHWCAIKNSVTPLNDTYWQNGIAQHVALFAYHLGDEEFI